MTATAPKEPKSAVVFGVAAVTAGVDWITKGIASAVLDGSPFEVGPFLMLRLSHNPGVAFSLGDGLPGPVILALTGAVTAAVALAALRGYFPSRFAAGLLLGGAVGNLVDRALGGTVVDFLDFGWWPSFNLADVWITVGVALTALASLRIPDSDAVTERR